jgi:hypothetical protein
MPNTGRVTVAATGTTLTRARPQPGELQPPASEPPRAGGSRSRSVRLGRRGGGSVGPPDGRDRDSCPRCGTSAAPGMPAAEARAGAGPRGPSRCRGPGARRAYKYTREGRGLALASRRNARSAIRNPARRAYKPSMNEPGQRGLPDDLQPVAARLRADRPQADPVRLDQIKQQVIVRSAAQQRRPVFMRSRIATVLTVLALGGGTGGAIAIAHSGSSGGPGGGAASGQYRPGKGCGDRNHHHTGSHGNKRPCPERHHGHDHDKSHEGHDGG